MKGPATLRASTIRRSFLRIWLVRLLGVLGDRPRESRPDLLDLWIARKRVRSLWG